MQVMFNLDEYREIKKEVTNKMLMKNTNSYADRNFASKNAE